MIAYAKPLPLIDLLTKPYWDAAKQHRLIVQRCASCGSFRFPIKPICNQCFSGTFGWHQMSGRAKVWSACEFYRQYFKGFESDIPYNVALVQLEEGPRMYTNLIDIPYCDITIGMAVKTCFEDVTDEVTLVKFRSE